MNCQDFEHREWYPNKDKFYRDVFYIAFLSNYFNSVPVVINH